MIKLVDSISRDSMDQEHMSRPKGGAILVQMGAYNSLGYKVNKILIINILNQKCLLPCMQVDINRCMIIEKSKHRDVKWRSLSL